MRLHRTNVVEDCWHCQNAIPKKTLNTISVVKKKVSELKRWHWGQDNVSCEPSDDEIRIAVQARDFERRAFQDAAVEAELMGEQDLQKRRDRIRQYHARRIAYFVEHGWFDPIVLFEDGFWIKEGSHRLRAAKYRGMEKVDCVIFTPRR